MHKQQELWQGRRGCRSQVALGCVLSVQPAGQGGQWQLFNSVNVWCQGEALVRC